MNTVKNLTVLLELSVERRKKIMSTAPQNAKFIRMTTEPIPRLIGQLAIPTIISMLVTTFYNLVDTLFIRQLANDSMVAAVGVVLPLMSIIQAFGFMLGHGSGSLISIHLGKGEKETADRLLSTAFFTALVFSLVLSAFLLGSYRDSAVTYTCIPVCGGGSFWEGLGLTQRLMPPTPCLLSL